jgi:hypothetical protein
MWCYFYFFGFRKNCCCKPASACRRRVILGKSLLPAGIGTLILESPYYGSRKPASQRGSKLLHVADLIKLGATTILEAVCLIRLLRAAGVLNVRLTPPPATPLTSSRFSPSSLSLNVFANVREMSRAYSIS